MNTSDEDDVNLITYLQVIIRRKLLFCFVIIAFLIAAFVVNLLSANQYSVCFSIKPAIDSYSEITDNLNQSAGNKFVTVFPHYHQTVSGCIAINDTVSRRMKVQLKVLDTTLIEKIIPELVYYVTTHSVYQKALEIKKSELKTEVAEINRALDSLASTPCENQLAVVDLRIRKMKLKTIAENGLSMEATSIELISIPVEPNKSRTYSLFSVLGILTGLFSVFVAEAYAKFRGIA